MILLRLKNHYETCEVFKSVADGINEIINEYRYIESEFIFQGALLII